MNNIKQRLGASFVWGSATSSYQIEGAIHEDGRGVSIWDTFSHTPGKILNNENGDIACDHFHRYPEDVAIMKDLGFKAYRFSTAWPRVQAVGSGEFNPKGLAFYERLIDTLLAADITPWITLYHWDLPQALEDKGGWLNRDTAHRFVDYADYMSKHLGDRVKNWITLNEPWVSAWLGYGYGIHAPGIKDEQSGTQASHNLLLAHGMAMPVIRANVPDGNVGITLNLNVTHPFTDSEEDKLAARISDGRANRLFLDPVFGKGYPKDITELSPTLAPEVQDGDMDIIAADIDFLGINYYTRAVVEYTPEGYNYKHVQMPGEHTHFNWEVYPDGLRELLEKLTATYNPKAMYITENGCAFVDTLEDDGQVHDERRTSYFQTHLEACAQAVDNGAPLKGYFAWSLLDNFEWGEGYDKRFGIVRVDYDTQKRTPKDSAKWLQSLIRS